MGMDNSYWDEVDEIGLGGFIEGLVGRGGLKLSMKERCDKQHSVIKMIKKIVIFSILMQSMNQKSNALQSILGIFLWAAHAPQKVINSLAHMGISISTDAINAPICT
ncbi:hypothetical protein PAXRUDRAFT_153072 [Paxillus rubicundulus Ve08.2h10]|uniref:Uncharacterized protein n=1 Tax=Paxillus rubicundulus Ve08.2h10 TaxID=930991 RepID=A0A0D0DMZ1_9AGAM|nr:hypothetical protein PAXRUDRAFT_153072 [Paxillus rubicundulus Ve08.2h10]